jgi:two-component system, OmpR family, copper resistance phosphate regulon response regulator CusR
MRILVVEDEPRIAQFLSSGLEAEGFTVDTAPDGESALARIGRTSAEFVILDLALPGMDGLDVLERLRQEHPDVAVLILSARRDIATHRAGLRGGACDYMVKPFSFDELVERIRIHQRSRTASSADGGVIQAGGLVLDVHARTVDSGTGPVALTGLEFRLLDYLIRHRGTTVSRQRLLSAVWGFSHQPNTNIVDVSVRRLRQKVGAERIETVRAAGYRLAD